MAELEVGRSSDPAVLAAQERVKLRNQIEQESREEAAYRALAMEGLREELGTSFPMAERMVQKHVAGSSAAERAAIEENMAKDPVATARVLFRRALGEIPTSSEARAAELEASHKRMRDDPSWHSDDRAALRYQILVGAKDGQGGDQP